MKRRYTNNNSGLSIGIILSCTIISILLVIILLLGGCSSKNDVDITTQEMVTLDNAIDSESARITEVGKAHERTVAEIVKVDGATPGEKILGLALVGRDFVAAATSKVGEIVDRFKRATLGTDVQVVVAKEAGKGIPFLTVGGVATVAIKQDKGSVRNTTTTGNIENSYKEDHATNIKSDGSATNQPAQDNSTKTEVADEAN